jgi:type I restriction enzyme M protein
LTLERKEQLFLFLQHFIKTLKARTRGKESVVVKNIFFSNTGNVSVSLCKELIKNCICVLYLDMSDGAFTGSGVKTVVLFFENCPTTRKFGIIS